MCHAVLIRVSPGYPPVEGRLHTRYAPVRRWHCCPLALHVLSLPLAFILSQDQTLHCKFCCGLFPVRKDRIFLNQFLFTLFIMSKNAASHLPKPAALIVLSAVVPDWECKSAAFFFITQVQQQSIFKYFFVFSARCSKWVKYAPKFFEVFSSPENNRHAP